jgi:type IV secretory pathway VirB2 component (pilin)
MIRMNRTDEMKSATASADIDKRPRGIPMRRAWFVVLLLELGAAVAFAQTDPWSTAATRLATDFTGPIAKGFALVAIVVGGLQLAFSEGSGKRALGGLIFGLGAALGASQFVTWLFS